MNRRVAVILSLATFLLYAWPMWRWLSALDQGPVTFAVYAPPAPSDNDPPRLAKEFITHDAGLGMVHVGSICEMADGSLVASWYGGTREGARDTVIYLAMRAPGESMQWGKPRVVVDRDSASKELYRYVKKIGNSLIFVGSEDCLWLIYVTVTVGGWSGSSLNAKVSYDAGTTWTASQRLTLSPLLNVSELVRNNPLPLAGGGFVIPIYHECVGKFPEMLWIRGGQRDQRITCRKTRMAGGRSFIQPSVVASGPRVARAFYRSSSGERLIGMATTGDTGGTWSEPESLELPNPDAALNALLLSKGRILLAFNDSKHTRDNLRLAISHDGGANWRRVAEIENSPGEEFSYPYMIRGLDGRIHLVYTWRRKHIKHVVYNENWINAQIEKASE
jgi:predicted neuraminidase